MAVAMATGSALPKNETPNFSGDVENLQNQVSRNEINKNMKKYSLWAGVQILERNEETP